MALTGFVIGLFYQFVFYIALMYTVTFTQYIVGQA